MLTFRTAVAAFLPFLVAQTACGSETYEFPSFGVRIQVSGGWTLVPATRWGHVAQWARLKGDGKTAKDVLTLELIPLSQEINPRQFARIKSEELKGTIEEEVQMGGLPALQIRAKDRDDGMTPRLIRVAARKGHLWVLSFWSSGRGGLATNTVNAVAKSIVWLSFASPADHLDMEAAYRPVLGGRLLVRLPEISRPLPTDNPGRTAKFSIQDYAHSTPEFQIQITLSESSGPVDRAAAQKRLAEETRARWPDRSDFKWQDITADVALMSPVVLEKKEDEAPFREYQYALLFRENAIGVFMFYVTSWNPDAAPKYHEVVRQILTTARFATEAKDTAKPPSPAKP